jgi:hypothetical protein
MTRGFRFVTAAGVAGLLAAAPAAAQAPAPGPAMVFISADAGMQVTTSTAESTVTYKLYGEDAVMKAAYEIPPAPVFGARAGVRIWRRLTVGAGVAVLTKDGTADIEATLPHPFFFQRPRQVEGTASGLKRDETAVYAEVGWIFPVTARLDVSAFAGPAFFQATQQTAVKVQYSESYPFDTATFVNVESVSTSVSATGFTVGADLAYRVTSTFGVGGVIRYSKASADIEPVAGQPFTLDLGGLHTTIGIRLRF